MLFRCMESIDCVTLIWLSKFAILCIRYAVCFFPRHNSGIVVTGGGFSYGSSV